MHKDSESRLITNCMARIFPSLVTDRGTQLEFPVFFFPFRDVEYIRFVEGRKGRSFKQAAVVGCVEDFYS